MNETFTAMDINKLMEVNKKLEKELSGILIVVLIIHGIILKV